MTTGRELEINLSTLLGLNNRKPDFRLRDKEGVFLRAAANALITDAGTARRRDGYTQVFNGSDCHSFWTDAATGDGYYVDGATLYRTTDAGDTLERSIVVADLVPGRQLTYARTGTDVVFSDGVTNRCLSTDGERAFGVPPLQRVPTVEATAGGGLVAGSYSVCFAYANDHLEISGTTPAWLVDVPQNGKLDLTDLPATWPRGVDMLLVYVSQPGGAAMFIEQRLLAPATTMTLGMVTGGGAECTTYLQASTPAGRILRWWSGRLYVANGSTLFYSDPYSPALYTPARNYVQFNAPITVVEPCDAGMYVVADKAYWLAGDITQATAKEVLPLPAAFGSSYQMPMVQAVYWMSPKGTVVGDWQGQVTLLQDENVVMPRAEQGATVVLEQDGQRHAVTSIFGVNGSSAAARSYMDAEVIRKGTTL